MKLKERTDHLGQTIAPMHTSKVFNPNKFTKTVKTLVKEIWKIRKEGHQIDLLAGCGNSGAPIVGALSVLTGIPFFIVRKESRADHDDRPANGFVPEGGGKYLIIDDLISSGTTVRRIIKGIRECRPMHIDRSEMPEPMGILLYDNPPNRSIFHWEDSYTGVSRSIPCWFAKQRERKKKVAKTVAKTVATWSPSVVEAKLAKAKERLATRVEPDIKVDPGTGDCTVTSPNYSDYVKNELDKMNRLIRDDYKTEYEWRVRAAYEKYGQYEARYPDDYL